MQAYTVYRVNYQTNKIERIGRVLDRRKEERNNNAEDMLRFARLVYKRWDSAIGSQIFILRERPS